MINAGVYLDATQLDVSGVYLEAVKNLAFPSSPSSNAKRGSFAGNVITVGGMRSYKIVTEWFIIGTTASDLASKRETLMGTIGTIISQGSAIFKMTKANGKVVQIEVVNAKVTGDISADSPFASKILIEFESEYPLLTSDTITDEDAYIFQGGGMAIPMAIPMDMGVGGANELTVTNNGNFEAYPTFTFNAPLSFATLKNVTTDKIINVNYTLSGSDYIVVDTYNRTALLYSGSTIGVNALQYITGDFWSIAKGANLIRLGSAVYDAGAKCTIAFRDSYLGV